MKKKHLVLPPPVKGEVPFGSVLEGNTPTAVEVSNFILHSEYAQARPSERSVLYEGVDISGAAPAGAFVFVCDAGDLVRIAPDGSHHSFGFVGVGSTMDYVKLNDWMYFTTARGVYRVGADFTPELISRRTPDFIAGAGTFRMAVTHMFHGMETPPEYVTGGNVSSDVPVRVYVRDEDAVYRFCGEGTHILPRVDSEGAPLQIEDAEVFPGGYFLTSMGGRLVSARNASIVLSLPYAVNLIDGELGEIEFTGLITFVVALDAATLAVGDARGVWLLHIAGDTPKLTMLHSSPAFYGTGALLENEGVLQTSQAAYVGTCLVSGGRLVFDVAGQTRLISQDVPSGSYKSSSFLFQSKRGVVAWQVM